MKNIIVFGDFILDKYIYCKSKKINSEYPNIVFENDMINYKIGGMGNVASNLSSLGFNVHILSILGNDEKSIKTKNLLNQNNINLSLIFDNDYSVTQKTRYICDNKQVFRCDKDFLANINDTIENLLIKKLNNLIKSVKISCLVISDYDKGIVKSSLTKTIIKICNNNNI